MHLDTAASAVVALYRSFADSDVGPTTRVERWRKSRKRMSFTKLYGALSHGIEHTVELRKGQQAAIRRSNRQWTASGVIAGLPTKQRQRLG